MRREISSALSEPKIEPGPAVRFITGFQDVPQPLCVSRVHHIVWSCSRTENGICGGPDF
jgi:hypothetical protein